MCFSGQDVVAHRHGSCKALLLDSELQTFLLYSNSSFCRKCNANVQEDILPILWATSFNRCRIGHNLVFRVPVLSRRSQDSQSKFL